MSRDYNDPKYGIYKQYSYRARAEALVDRGIVSQEKMDSINESGVSIISFPEIQSHIESGQITVDEAVKLNSRQFTTLMRQLKLNPDQSGLDEVNTSVKPR